MASGFVTAAGGEVSDGGDDWDWDWARADSKGTVARMAAVPSKRTGLRTVMLNSKVLLRWFNNRALLYKFLLPYGPTLSRAAKSSRLQEDKYSQVAGSCWTTKRGIFLARVNTMLCYGGA